MARLAGKTGNVYVGTVVINPCEVLWAEQVNANVTASLDTSDYKVGNAAMKFVCAAGLANGDIIASAVIGDIDITSCSQIMWWAKSTVNINAPGDLQLLISEQAMCVSPLAVDMPALTANVWKFCKSPVVADPAYLAGLDHVISLGAKLTANDPGAFTLRLDQIVAAKSVAGIRSWKLDRKYDTQDTTGFDSAGHRTFLPVLSGWSGSFDGFKDGAPLAIGTVVGLELQESATATQQYRGIAILSGSHPAVSVDGLAVTSYDFQGVGPIEAATA